MKKICAALALTAMYSNVIAEWVKLDPKNNTNIVMYVDHATIRKTGSTSKMWSLIDLKTQKVDSDSGKPFFSSKDQSEYDCKNKRMRLLFFSNHSKNMGSGDVVYFSKPTLEWTPIPPDSFLERLWRVACGKN